MKYQFKEIWHVYLKRYLIFLAHTYIDSFEGELTCQQRVDVKRNPARIIWKSHPPEAVILNVNISEISKKVHKRVWNKKVVTDNQKCCSLPLVSAIGRSLLRSLHLANLPRYFA